MKQIEITKDGWVSLDDQGLGDLNVDVEILDLRKQYVSTPALIFGSMLASIIVLTLISLDSSVFDAMGVFLAIAWGSFMGDVRA
jgi:hypothetical protein